MYDLQALQALKRKQLQALAKANDIAANKSSVVIIEQLQEIFCKEMRQQNAAPPPAAPHAVTAPEPDEPQHEEKLAAEQEQEQNLQEQELAIQTDPYLESINVEMEEIGIREETQAGRGSGEDLH